VDDAHDPVPALKQQLARALIERFGSYNQCIIASRVGIDQPRASELLRGRIERFSLQQLVRFVARADGDLSLAITWTSNRIFIINPLRHRLRAFLDSRRTAETSSLLIPLGEHHGRSGQPYRARTIPLARPAPPPGDRVGDD
jgi:predicted XRE-type DNA-binding protein